MAYREVIKMDYPVRPSMTDKEMMMLDLISQGKPYKVIEVELEFTRKQIDHRLERLREEMNASTTTQLIAIAIRNGII